MYLSYISPVLNEGQAIVQLEKERVEREATKRDCAFIAYFVGDTPGYNAFFRYIKQYWANIRILELYYHEEGYYIVRFQMMADKNEFYTLVPPQSTTDLLYLNLGLGILILT